MAVSVRRCETHELERVLEVWQQAEAEPSVSDDLASLRRLLDHAPWSLLVAVLEGEIVGTVVVAWDGWRGNLSRLAVVPQHRRRGIGRNLVRDGELALRRQGAVRLTAIVVEDHEQATGFWEAAGYERQPLRLRFVKNLGS